MTTRRRKEHRPEEIVAKLRDADAMLTADKDLAAVLQASAMLKADKHWASLFDKKDFDPYRSRSEAFLT